MERLGLAVIRAYDLGLLARALSTGRRYDGVGWAGGAVARPRFRCPNVYRACFKDVNPPHALF